MTHTLYKTKCPAVPMTTSGFCAFPSADSHSYCTNATCQCSCHGERPAPPMRRGQIVSHVDGSKYLYLSTSSNGKHVLESLDTAERLFVVDTDLAR